MAADPYNTNIVPFPTARRAPFASPRVDVQNPPPNVSLALVKRADEVVAEQNRARPRRGVGHGQRQFWPTIANSPREWVAAAKSVRAAMVALNRLLPAEGHERGRTPGDHADPDCPELAEAFEAYRQSLVDLLKCEAVKPRHVLDILRAAAELMDLQDPVWAYMDTAATPQERVFAFAVQKVRQALAN